MITGRHPQKHDNGNQKAYSSFHNVAKIPIPENEIIKDITKIDISENVIILTSSLLRKRAYPALLFAEGRCFSYTIFFVLHKKANFYAVSNYF